VNIDNSNCTVKLPTIFDGALGRGGGVFGGDLASKFLGKCTHRRVTGIVVSEIRLCPS
jgi:hypothetical protein